MSELFETAVTGDQFLTAMQDTLIMVGLSLGFGSLLGLPLGIVLHRFIMDRINVDFINFRMHISLASFAIAFVATFVFTLLVDLVMRRKLDRINMAESLKSVE